jgi:hypothetical protein
LPLFKNYQVVAVARPPTWLTYGWLKLERSIDELDQAITEALTPFGFKQTGSSVDSMVRDLSFESDEFDIPADKKPSFANLKLTPQ